ncbi:MAG: AAA family ATPase [Acidimicrobiia bacterium]|nr:AAA family ATPase [Acidimicrobiia bacterium]
MGTERLRVRYRVAGPDMERHDQLPDEYRGGTMNMDVARLGGDLVRSAERDVSRQRERRRRRRLWTWFAVLAIPCVLMWWGLFEGAAFTGWPTVPDWFVKTIPLYIIVILVGLVLLVPLLGAGRSPHVLYRPSEIDIGLDDVVGAGAVKEEVVRSLNLFLAHKTFREGMGGTPRRAVLFEGPPGTGKTYMAKAMAKEARVPFLYVSSSSFQSMYYGQTNRKIRTYFKKLRKHARQEGGAIGFIEEIDAIAASRSGMRATPLDVGTFGVTGTAASDTGTRVEAAVHEGITGIVNELLVQLQSFDLPTTGQRIAGWFIDRLNRFLPEENQLRKPMPVPANILVIGATNRAADLDPALLRPGRFDRTIHFDLPSRGGRREIIDYYLDRKSHVDALDDPDRRDTLAAMTFGYSPVMLEHILDEALVWAVRDGRTAMTWRDIQQAKMTEELGLKQPVEYSAEEKHVIATHEAGHAVVAYLRGVGRKLEVLSIIKRREALGLLAHSETEERFTKSRDEVEGLIKIAFGGMVAEELWFGQSGTGAAGDLQAATRLAARMVGTFGMAGSLVSFDATQATLLSGDTIARVLADAQARPKVEEILESAKSEVELLLAQNRHLVEALCASLLEQEELLGEEIIEVLREAEAAQTFPQPALAEVAATLPHPDLRS